MMAETCLLERLTASDLFLLLWDDYGWSSDIGGPAAVGAVAATRPAGAAGGRVLAAASRRRRRRRGAGRLRGAAGPGPQRACPGRTAVDTGPVRPPAAGRQPAPAPGRARPRGVGPCPLRQDRAPGATGLAGLAGSPHRSPRSPHQP